MGRRRWPQGGTRPPCGLLLGHHPGPWSMELYLVRLWATTWRSAWRMAQRRRAHVRRLICGERGELGTSGIHVGQAVRCRFLIVPSLEAARRGRGGAGTGPAGPMEIGVTLAWLLIVLSGVWTRYTEARHVPKPGVMPGIYLKRVLYDQQPFPIHFR